MQNRFPTALKIDWGLTALSEEIGCIVP